MTYTFCRSEQGWHIAEASQRDVISRSEEVLDVIADGIKTVSLSLSVHPFAQADVLRLHKLCHAPKGGGYYILQTYRGRSYNRKMWLCDLPLLLFGDFPEKIYIRQVSRDQPCT